MYNTACLRFESYWLWSYYIVDSNPEITFDAPRICILRGQNVNLTCKVKYNGTNLMPLLMRWTDSAGHDTTVRNVTTVNGSSEYQTSLAFTATEQIPHYICTVSFSSPTGIVLSGVAKQHANAPNGTYASALVAFRRVVGTFWCSSIPVAMYAFCLKSELAMDLFSLTQSNPTHGHRLIL